MYGQKLPKTVKGTPLNIPDFTGAHNYLALFNDRHTLEEKILRLPRCHYSVIIAALCLCFGVPGVCGVLRFCATGVSANKRNRQRARWGRIQRGGCAPSLCRFRVWGYIRGEGNRNSSPLMRVFGDFLHEQKATRQRRNKNGAQHLSKIDQNFYSKSTFFTSPC